MRKMLPFVLLLVLTGFTWAFAGLGAPLTPVAHVHDQRGKMSVVFQWTDTNSQTIAWTIVRRRTTTGADTTWRRMGKVSAKGLIYIDPGVTSGRTYKYAAADSVAATALSSWSDSSTVVVP